MCAGVHLTHNIVRAYVVGMALVLISSDISSRSVGMQPIWPTFVLLADLSLVVGLSRRFATWLMGFTALWVIISVSETILRFGLFDLPGSAPDWYRWENIRGFVECTDPPCPISPAMGMYEMEISLIVLVVDFIATRGFAESAEREKAAMGRTIETVEAIAQLLAGYDVDTVAEMLQEAEAEGRLPAAMHEALRRLEQNLRAYRPYLPKSCLPAQQDDGEVDAVAHSTILSDNGPSFSLSAVSEGGGGRVSHWGDEGAWCLEECTLNTACGEHTQCARLSGAGAPHLHVVLPEAADQDDVGSGVTPWSGGRVRR